MMAGCGSFRVLKKRMTHILSPPEIHVKPGIEWSKPILCKDSKENDGLKARSFLYHHGFIIPSPPPSPKELIVSSENMTSSTFVARVFDLYRKNPRAMLRNERRWLGAQPANRRKPSRVPLRRRPKPIVRPSRPVTSYTSISLPNHKPKQSSREHYAHTHSFDVANTPYELLPDFCPPTSTLDKINHPRPLRAEWKGIPLDLSNDPHVDQLHPAEVYLASQLRLPAMVYLDNKRRIFAEYHARKEAGLGFRRTDAQRCARIDVNKASRLWQAFERPYRSLQLDIEPLHIGSIEEALQNITQPEVLHGDWHSSLGEKLNATKQVFIETLPQVLILHLKRFVYDNVGGTQKSYKNVHYPLQFEIPPSVMSPHRRSEKNTKFVLFAVVYHHGMSASGGHYTVDLLRQDMQSWIRIDDTHISHIFSEHVVPSSDEESPNRFAYLLFYLRL
ncbi:hypothetical protein PCK1_001483 [Pneumocystis canis]|nr:hypothetical protein PCK1_001483 [Pneumocystis canis]